MNKAKTLVLVVLLLLSIVGNTQAATRLEIKGGIYAEACPNGQFASLIWGSHIGTDVGSITLPPGGNLLGLRIPCDGSPRICGTGHTDDVAYEWDGQQWHNRGLAFGLAACIYDSNKQLRIVRGPGEPTGAQGFRYVDGAGRIIPAFETYADPQRQIFEYTQRGNFTVGQGAETDCHVLTPERRFVEKGDCRFAHYNEAGGVNAIGVSLLAQGKSVLLWLSNVEMANLPLVDSPPPPLEICGDGKDNDGDGLIDENPPCDPPLQTPNDAGIVIATDQAHSELLDRNRHEDACRFTHLAALNLNAHDSQWGMLTKPPGQNGCDIKGGRYAVDAVIYKATQQVVDIISGAGDEVPAVTTWGFQPKRPDNHWALPPDAEEPPPPPPDDLEERVEALEKAVRDLQFSSLSQKQDIEMLSQKVLLQQQQIDELFKQSGLSEARVRAIILDYISRMTLQGNTSTSFGHRHGAGNFTIVVK